MMSWSGGRTDRPQLNGGASAADVERESASSWLIRYEAKNREPARLRLFCFHYAGATASIFRTWQAALPPAAELVAVQLPGREYRLDEPLLSDIGQIVAGLIEVVPALLDRPFVFFGHSMGALIAFDLIRTLRARGLRQPELFIVSGRNAPQFKWRDAGVEALPDDQFIAAVRDYNGVPDALLNDETLRDLWLPRLRADLAVSATYRYVPQRPLDCPILVMFGANDQLLSDIGLRGWLTQTNARVRFSRYPGNHFFLHTAERLVLGELRCEVENQLPPDGHPGFHTVREIGHANA
jgi:medium-chain acyl-[acyl-carrier-protein] hydrolase